MHCILFPDLGLYLVNYYIDIKRLLTYLLDYYHQHDYCTSMQMMITGQKIYPEKVLHWERTSSQVMQKNVWSVLWLWLYSLWLSKFYGCFFLIFYTQFLSKFCEGLFRKNVIFYHLVFSSLPSMTKGTRAMLLLQNPWSTGKQRRYSYNTKFY